MLPITASLHCLPWLVFLGSSPLFPIGLMNSSHDQKLKGAQHFCCGEWTVHTIGSAVVGTGECHQNLAHLWDRVGVLRQHSRGYFYNCKEKGFLLIVDCFKMCLQCVRQTKQLSMIEHCTMTKSICPGQSRPIAQSDMGNESAAKYQPVCIWSPISLAHKTERKQEWKNPMSLSLSNPQGISTEWVHANTYKAKNLLSAGTKKSSSTPKEIGMWRWVEHCRSYCRSRGL